VQIWKARLETISGSTEWVFHPIHTLTQTGTNLLFISNVYQKRLWICSSDSTEAPYYMPLPEGYGDVTSDANRSFLTGGHFETPWLHGEFKGDTKRFVKVTLHLGHSYDADIYFEVHCKKWGDASWTDAGDAKGTSSDRSPTIFLPDDGSNNPPTATLMKLMFVARTDDTTKTPILNGYDVRAILYPTRRKLIRCVVRAADDIKDRHGVDMGQTAAYVQTVLEEARDSTEPFSFYDINGVTKTVKMESADPFSRVIRQEKGRNVELHYNLVLEEVALS